MEMPAGNLVLESCVALRVTQCVICQAVLLTQRGKGMNNLTLACAKPCGS